MFIGKRAESLQCCEPEGANCSALPAPAAVHGSQVCTLHPHLAGEPSGH